MANGEGELAGHGLGVVGNDGTRHNVPGVIGDDFDKAKLGAVNLACGSVRELNDAFVVAFLGAAELRFIVAKSDHGGQGIDGAWETGVVGHAAGFVGEVVGNEAALVLGASGGGIIICAVADGIDVLGTGLEISVGLDKAGFIELYASGGEAVVVDWAAAGGKDDAIHADHFFGFFGFEDDVFGGVVLADGGDFGAGEDSDFEVALEVLGHGGGNVWILVGEQAAGLLGNKSFDAKGGVVFGQLAAGGATADDNGGLGQAADFEGVIWGEARHGI